MAKSLLSHYGPESKPGGKRAECGGVTMKDTKELPYSPPLGPKGQTHSGPGLGGTNHGTKVNQGRH